MIHPLQVVTWAATPSGLVTLTFDLLTLELVRNVSRDTDNLHVKFGVSATFRCRVMGKHASEWRHDLITMTFDLSTSKWGHGSSVSRASFLPIFSLLCRSILDLGPGTGQTDGRTDDGHQRFMPPPYGDGGITKDGDHKFKSSHVAFNEPRSVALIVQ